jgi:hypothetical protein
MSGEMSVREMLDGVDYVTKEKLCRCTVRYTNSYGITKVRHWRTDVLTFYPNGHVAIHLHGWWSATTVMRVNRYMPHGGVSQRRGKKFYWAGGNGKTYYYQEGMITDESGIPISDDVLEYIPRERKPGSTTSKW